MLKIFFVCVLVSFYFEVAKPTFLFSLWEFVSRGSGVGSGVGLSGRVGSQPLRVC
jgi:hypothetical protein